MPPPANIFLIGYRGTGKSAVARVLAPRLGWTAVDADALLEAQAGRTIRAVFSDEGEAGFRDREAAILSAICQSSQQVVATGGGVILREENRSLLKQSGLCVWLTADAPTLWQRLQHDDTTADRRPNLTVGGLAEIEDLLRQREPWYAECARLVVDATRGTPEEIAEAIRRQLADVSSGGSQHTSKKM